MRRLEVQTTWHKDADDQEKKAKHGACVARIGRMLMEELDKRTDPIVDARVRYRIDDTAPRLGVIEHSIIVDVE